MSKKTHDDKMIRDAAADELLLLLKGEESEISEIQTPEEAEGETPRRLPETRKYSRVPLLQNEALQRGLFDELWEQVEHGSLEVTSKIPSVISDLEFNAYLTGAMALLSDQSYLYHNEEELSGMSKYTDVIRRNKNVIHKGYVGVIDASLTELCREGYGLAAGEKPTKRQREGMIKAIKALHNNSLDVRYPSGDIEKSILISRMGEYIRKSDGARMYRLVLNPIFTHNKFGFGLVPRGALTLIAENLKAKGNRLTETYHKFLHLLIVTRGDTLHMAIETLAKRLGLSSYLSKDRKKLIAKLALLFRIFREEGFILEEPDPTIPPDGMFHIPINKDFMAQRKTKRIKKEGDQ